MSEELILSPADPGWHERRREVYTASDMGLLFGLKGFGGRTISDVWYEKRYGLVGDKGNSSTRLGQKMEPAILDEAESILGKIVERQSWFTDGVLGATLDGRCDSDGRPVEAKTSGLLWKADEQWGEGGDECPDGVILQVQTQILLTESDLGYVPAIIAGRGFMLYEVPRSDSIIAEMRARAAAFLKSLALDTPPDAPPPQIDTLKRLKRQPNKTAQIPDEVALRFMEAKSTEKEAKESTELAQRELLAAMEDADAGESRYGRFTYFEQTNHYAAREASETTFRVLRVKK